MMSWLITGTEKYETDPYRSQVSLLLHGDGTNGSTTIVDNSPSPKTVTAFGDAQISTAQSKFGGASIAFDGSGDYLELSKAVVISETSDFTIELWVRQASPTTAQVLVSDLTQNVQIFRLNDGVSGRIECGVYGLGYPGRIFFANVLSTLTWHHLAFCRNGSTLTLFVDGTSVGSSTASLPVFSVSLIGSLNGTSLYSNGYIDDLRVTKGVARYTSNFTPPTAPFPDI